MLRARYATLFLVPALLTGYVACVGNDASEENNGAAEAEMKGAPPIIGTFRDEGAMSGIALLTLKSDMTFHLEEAVPCTQASCPRRSANGWYRLGNVDGNDVLTMVDERSRTPEQLRYMYWENVLYVAPVSRYYTWWQALPRSEPAWCGVPNDCTLQDLQVGPCAGEWYCASNACNYSCGPVTCQMTNTCPDR
jgi:hypothetical protein